MACGSPSQYFHGEDKMIKTILVSNGGPPERTIEEIEAAIEYVKKKHDLDD